MPGFVITQREREQITRAVEISGSRAAFARQVMRVGEQLEVRRPATHKSAETAINKIVQNPQSGAVSWMRDLLLVAAEELIEKEAGSATIEELRAQLEQEIQRSEDYRESCLKKEAVIRGKDNEISRLTTELKLVKGSKSIITEVEKEALAVLEEVVSAENGDLDPLLLKAARLVIRAEGN